MNRLRFTAAAIVLGFGWIGLGSGCARFVAKPLDAEASASALTAKRLSARVWSLEALAAEAEANQPEVILARSQYETARAALITAGERPNPTVALSPQFPVEMRNFLTGTYGIDFDWTVETGGKRSHRLEIAHANLRVAAGHLSDTVWKARGAVRKAMLDYDIAQQRGRLLEEALAQQGEVLIMLDERIQAGAESRSTQAQPRLLRDQLRLQQAEAEKAESLARVALAESLGMGLAGVQGARFSFAEFDRAPGPLPSYRHAALTHRSDILAALADYAAAEGALRLEIARQYPDLHLNPGYQLDDNEHKWTIGVGLTLPLLNHNQGPIAEAEAKRKESAARFRAVQAKALAECDRAAVALTAARRKLTVTDELLMEQSKQVESEQRLLASGAGDKLGLRTSLVEQVLSKSARLDAWADYQTALGALEEAAERKLP